MARGVHDPVPPVAGGSVWTCGDSIANGHGVTMQVLVTV